MKPWRILLLGLVASFVLAACSSPFAPRFPQPSDDEEPPPEQEERTGFLTAPSAPVSGFFFG
jgi:hypothetical protein